MDLQKGDILFSRPKKPNKFRYLTVELPQGEPFGHISIYVGNNAIVESQIVGGVRKKTFKEWSERNSFKVFRVVGVSSQQQEKAARIANKMVGKEYDILGALKGFLKPNPAFKKMTEHKKVTKSIQGFNSLFCSSVIVGAYPDVMFSLQKHPVDLMPIDIMRSPKVIEVK
jgi:hypothetical protein